MTVSHGIFLRVCWQFSSRINLLRCSRHSDHINIPYMDSHLGSCPRGSTLNEGHRMVPVLVKAALKMADKINRRIG